MTLDELLIECTDYDFKETMEEKKPKSWLKSISAFSNGFGGSLFFGINDKKEIVGLDNAKYDGDKISELIKAKIDPIPIYELIPHKLVGKDVIEIRVPGGSFTPYYYYSDGNRIAYIRSGNESIPAPHHIIVELILKGKGQTYDSIDSGIRKDDLAFAVLKSTFYSRTNTKFLDSDFVSFNLVNSEGNLTRAGVLFADENPYFQSRIFCTRWNGVDKISEKTVLDDLEVKGSLLTQLNSALSFFRSNTKRPWHKDGGDTIWELEYDEEAVKEALVNAIIHRDYNVMGAEVVLNIYNDRIEITSPGMMFDGSKIPLIVSSTLQSSRRNPIVADLFWRMGLMHRRGSGLANITNRTNELFGDKENHVFFKTEYGFFKTIIYNAKYNANDGTTNGTNDYSNLNEQEKTVLLFIKKNNHLSLDEMSSAINIPRRTLARIISSLKEKGLIERIGSNKTGHWEVIA